MPQSHLSGSRPSLCPVAMSCYSAAACAALGALIGLVNSHFPATGFAAIAGFYLTAGLIDQFVIAARRQPSTVSMHTAASGAENLVAEAVGATVSRDLATSTH